MPANPDEPTQLPPTSLNCVAEEPTTTAGATSLQQPRPLSPSEELANAITHGIGLLLSLVGTVALLSQPPIYNDAKRAVGCGIYVASLVTVFFASTLSHLVSAPQWRRAFRSLDQAAIYLLIVGTYTPISLTYLHSGWWWLLLLFMWTAALFGFISKLIFSHRIDAVTIWSYLVLAWILIFPVPFYVRLIPLPVLWWTLIGGLCYTAGTIFLLLDRRFYHFHGIWHLFVIAGSICHYLVIFRFVAQEG